MKNKSHLAQHTAALGAVVLSAGLAFGQATSGPEAGASAGSPPNVPASAPAAESNEEEIITLSPFEVTAEPESGYRATDTLAGTRIRTNLRDVGSAITVVTPEFLKDVGATDSSTLLQYTPNAEVSGTRGTYAGLGAGTSVEETGSLRAPGGAQRVRGLAAADNTRDFFATDIPWDSYITDRVDIQRGPNSLLFGLGSPAGIVNASLDTARFVNSGEATFRYGSYGSARSSVDVNREIVKDILAIRVEGLWDHERFKQDPAFEDDERMYAAIRFEPKLFSESFRTTIRANYETGEIEANRPRIIPPYDSITPWFKPNADGAEWGINDGMGKTPITNPYDADRNDFEAFPTSGDFYTSWGMSRNDAANPNYQPWLGFFADQQQPIFFVDGASGQILSGTSGYMKQGSRNPSGSLRGVADEIFGRRWSAPFFTLGNYQNYAQNARLPMAGSGQYRAKSLTDSSVFDFYNNLIDGPNKNEWEDWDAFSLSFSQTALNDRVGLEVSYDNQEYSRGGSSFFQWTPTLSIDIMRNGQDFYTNGSANGVTSVTNPNYGRPYITSSSGGRGSSYESDRENARASLFAELRAADITDNEFLVKLFGRQRFNAVYSEEDFFSENRSWYGLAHDQAWAAYSFANDGLANGFSERAPVVATYLGGPIADLDSASGANIPRVTDRVQMHSTTVRVFDSTWVNHDVGYGDPWTMPANLRKVYADEPAEWSAANAPTGWTSGDPYYWTQASNPANYLGWTNYPIGLMLNDERGSNEQLLASAGKSLRQTTSEVLSWQGYLWNDAIVPTYGWRRDKVETRGINASPRNNLRKFLDVSPGVYELPKEGTTFEDESTTWGVVVHFNRLFGDRDPLPINVSASYNQSENFAVTSVRRDVWGQPIGNPTGSTKDYGVILATKDNKYSLRLIKYETELLNATSSMSDQAGIAAVIQDGMNWRNVFLYDLSSYDWTGRESPSYRNTWTNAYPVDGYDDMTPEQQAAADAAAQSVEDQAIRGWNEIQGWLTGKGFFDAWGFQPVPLEYLTDRSTYEATVDPTTRNPSAQYLPPAGSVTLYNRIQPQGYSVTADTFSKGYEFEFVANPLPGWRIAFNGSRTEATETNVGGGAMTELVDYLASQLFDENGDPTPAGLLPRWGGAGAAFQYHFNNWRANYVQMKLREGSNSPEIRKWRFNLVTNYTFQENFLRGLGVGGSYRWQDKVAIGYPVLETDDGYSFDLDNPYYGPKEDALDLWVSYERRISDAVMWKVQLNVRNAFEDEGLIPISTQPDGSWASVRIKPTQEWFLTNTFTF